jgi:hypothetical protein
MINLITDENLRLTLRIALILLRNTGNELAVLLALELTGTARLPSAAQSVVVNRLKDWVESLTLFCYAYLFCTTPLMSHLFCYLCSVSVIGNPYHPFTAGNWTIVCLRELSLGGR